MSLSDRYNRGDGRIQKFDRYLTDLGNDAGNLWADQTGWSRRALTQGLFVVAALAATQHGVLYHNPFLYLIAGLAVFSFTGMAGQSSGGIVEQLQAEAAGLPRNAIATLRLLMLFVGVLNMSIAVSRLAFLITDHPFTAGIVIEPLLIGIAFVSLQASEYISRTNPATPGKGGPGKLVNASQI